MSAPHLADRGSRVLAAAVDTCLVGAGAFAGSAIATLGVRALGDPAGATVWVFAAEVGGVVTVQCAQWWLVAKDGQSLGKRWLDIRIERLDGTPPGFFYGVVVRSWLRFGLAWACAGLALVDLLPVFGADRRTLHDHVAGTRVVRLDALPCE